MVCCLNPECDRPLHPDGTSYCQNCGVAIIPLLRSHYKIINRLGRGGFGTTYLAEDVDKLDQLCVVKQLTPSVQGTYANKKALELFEQEARQLQELGEQNRQIPSLHGYFEEESYFYLVQQYIRGQNLLKELEQRKVWTG
jgi:serine/threonine protein kinase